MIDRLNKISQYEQENAHLHDTVHELRNQLTRKYNHVRKLKKQVADLTDEVEHLNAMQPADAEISEVKLLQSYGLVTDNEPVAKSCPEALMQFVSQSGELPSARKRDLSSQAYSEGKKRKSYSDEVNNLVYGKLPRELDQRRLQNDWRFQLRQKTETFMFTPICYESQSGETEDGANITESQPVAREQILEFNAENAGYTYTRNAMYEGTMDHGYNVDANLGDSLARPVKIYETSWDVGQSLLDALDPWELLHKNEYFYDKTKNYELLRHKLHMRVVISGTPFHYGRALVSYNPIQKLDNDLELTRAPVAQDVIRCSQRPHIWIDPSANQGGDIEVPFFWTENFISITDDLSFALGTVTLQSTQALRHANGGDDPVSISIFAWASDIKLAVPTSHVADPPTAKKRLVYQSQSGLLTKASKDEYGMGIISKPASAVARAAGALSTIPVISPYARATEIAASAVGKIAMMFGFSRPPVVSEITLVKPLPQGNLANVDASDAIQKLSLDSKAELTIDPTTVGLAPQDEMSILGFVKRESFLTTFDMQANESPGTNLFECRVTPSLFDRAQQTHTEYHATPMAYMAQCFNYWHGSITYKFQIVKSKFHKGKIVVEYDPSYFATQEASFNTNYTRVIDIADHDDFEITIGWCQAQPFKQCSNYLSSDLPFRTTGGFAPEYEFTNGMIRIQVLNQLVAPAADSNISFNVFVRMEDDAKFGMPTTDGFQNLSVFTPLTEAPKVFQSQSGENLATSAPTKPVGADAVGAINVSGSASDHYMEVFFGESPTSIRELIKRYSLHRVHSTGAPDPNLRTDIAVTATTRPYYRGYDVSGIDATPAGDKYNYVLPSFWTHFAPAYAGFRGAFRKKFVFAGTQNVPYQPFVANATTNDEAYRFRRDLRQVQPSDRASIENTMALKHSTVAGTATTVLGVNGAIETEFPYYENARFTPARQVSSSDSRRRKFVLHMGLNPADITDQRDPVAASEYTAAGEDMSFFFFSGIPVTYNVPDPDAT